MWDAGPSDESPLEVTEEERLRYLTARSIDGSWNDLDHPRRGMIGGRFGRNIPPEYAYPEKARDLLSPSPREVSRQLLTRTEFKPAESLNVLAAAWLQFEVHDWFSHGKPIETEDRPSWPVEIDQGDEWPGDRPMKIMRTRPDPSNDPPAEGFPPTFVTADTHWWDGSQLYGRDKQAVARARGDEPHGKLRVVDGLLPRELDEGVDLGDTPGSSWLGLLSLHTLFSLEHNSICDRIRTEHPNWSGDRIFDKARLVNAALMAKIHTVDWTPAVIAHRTAKLGSKLSWNGLVGDGLKKRFPALRNHEVLHGIPGTRRDDGGVPFSLTEEFVAVYRMHSLVPDEFTFRSLASDALLRDRPLTLREIGAPNARDCLEEFSMANSLYSLGISQPGRLTLHNFPRFLQEFERPVDKTVMDLGAVDILRDRERGIPRYNEFRRLFHLPAVQSFYDLTPNRVWADEIREVYGDDIERVDLLVGLHAEPPPEHFGFSDTAFRVFMLMASRRLKSDRFFTDAYGPDAYTAVGLDWIKRNNFRTVLLRHYPQLEPALREVKNAFVPWHHVNSKGT